MLERLARLNPTTAFLIALAVMLLGLFLPGIIGGALLLAVAAGLAALLATTWPIQRPATRTLRLLMLALLLLIALAKIL